MLSPIGQMRKMFMGMPLHEAGFATRGFYTSTPPATQKRLEYVGKSVVQAYNVGIELADDMPSLLFWLEGMEHEAQGFVHEGVGMAMAFLDLLTPWKRDRFQAYVTGHADKHVYISYIGAGLAHAVLNKRLDSTLVRLDQFLRWLLVDGYGFFHAFFRTPGAVGRQEVPDHLQGYARRAFDHGVGRALWFVGGANPAQVAKLIGAFPAERHADLWSGLGLAVAYAGAVDRAEIERVRDLAGPHAPQLAQGAALAARARDRADNHAPHTELACQVLFGSSAADVHRLTEKAERDLPPDSAQTPAWEVWRQRIQREVQVEIRAA